MRRRAGPLRRWRDCDGRYALVWSKDGVFEGLQADGVPVDANDKVVLVAPKVGGSGFYKVIRN